MLDMERLLAEGSSEDASRPFRDAFDRLSTGKGWEEIKALLRSRTFRKQKINASLQGRTIEKWRVVVTVTGGKRKQKQANEKKMLVTEERGSAKKNRIGGDEDTRREAEEVKQKQSKEEEAASTSKEAILGRPFESESVARGAYDDYTFEERTVESPFTGEKLVARPYGQIRVGHLFECLRVATGLDVDVSAQREFAAMALPRSSPCCVRWIAALEREAGLCDSFAVMRPSAEGRFTCWDQYKNRRYRNEGARIDYILVDAGFLEDGNVIRGPGLYGGVNKGDHSAEGDAERKKGKIKLTPDESEEAALNACTAFGRWRQAPFEGGGLPDGMQEDYETEFYAPHTGMVYTPPQYSDHIGVSLLLRLPKVVDAPRRFCKKTRKCQPHKRQTRLDSFFRSSSSSSIGGPAKDTKDSDQKVRKEAGKRKSNIRSYFSAKQKKPKSDL